MALNEYQDRWARFHNKKVTFSNPIPSNNGWIYTTYAKAKGLGARKALLRNCFDKCVVSLNPMVIHRSPDDPKPPLSKDEIWGLFLEGLVSVETIMENNWIYYRPYGAKKYPIHQYITEGAKLFWYSIIKKERNAVWEKDLRSMYDVAFKLPKADRYAMLKIAGKKPFILKAPWFYISAAFNGKFGSNSIKNYLWIQLYHMGQGEGWIARKCIKPWVSFVEYFGKDHVIAKRWLRETHEG